MTVSSDLNRISYTGNGTTTAFPVNYYFLENSHLLVVLRSATGVETTQTLTTNYTVTGAGNEAGGSVTMLVAPPVGTTLVIQREVPATQETDYLANDPFPAESHERALDKLTMITQQNSNVGDRSIKIPITETNNTQVPNNLIRANRLLGFGSNGDVSLSGSTIVQVDSAVEAITTIASAPSGNSASISHIAAGIGATPTTVQTKLRETVSLEDFGASPTSTPNSNAAAFIAAIQAGGYISRPKQAYTFQFDGTPITYSGAVLDIDLGPYKHTFLNFGGIVGDNVTVLRYNGRFTANNGFCKGFGSFRNLLLVDIDTIEITDVYCDANAGELGFFGLEYSSSIFSDNQFTFGVKNAVFKNILIETVTFAGGPVAMTGFGNFGSSSLQAQQHLLHFDNLYVENFFSVTTDGVTIIDGDSDFFRLFTNPTQLTIGNCTLINVGKRFIKTQERAEVVVNNLVASLDNRFTVNNFIGLFEGQATAQTSGPTKFTVLQADVQFSTPDGLQKIFFNASGLDHEMYVYNMTYSNISVFSASQDIFFYAENIKGSRLFINTPFSTRITARGIKDDELIQCRGSADIENFVLTLRNLGTDFSFSNVNLRNGVFENVDVSAQIAIVRNLENVSINYTTGTTSRRPLRPVNSGIVKISGLTVNSIGPSIQTFEAPGTGGSGTIIIRDYRSTNQTLAFFSSGTWNFVLDNCVDDTVTGAGVASVVRATYA